MNDHDARVRSVAGFRRTLGAQGAALEICPQGCTVDHDAGKVPGKDHWQATPVNGKPAPVCRVHRIVKLRRSARSAYRCRACDAE